MSIQQSTVSKITNIFTILNEEGIVSSLLLSLDNSSSLVLADKDSMIKMLKAFGHISVQPPSPVEKTKVVEEETENPKVEPPRKHSGSLSSMWEQKNKENRLLGGTAWDREENEILVEAVLGIDEKELKKRGVKRNLWLRLASGVLDRTPDAISSNYTKLLRQGDFNKIATRIERKRAKQESLREEKER
jgi:hypothetical protein